MTPEERQKRADLKRTRKALGNYIRNAKAQLHEQLDELLEPNIKDIVRFLLAGGGVKLHLQLAAPEGAVDAAVAPEPEPNKPLIQVVTH